MKAGNVKLMAAAAVVVALCLVFAFVTLDDGEDDGTDTWRTEVSPGDYYSMYLAATYGPIAVDADLTARVLAVSDDMYLVEVTMDGETAYPEWMPYDDYIGAVLPVGEPIRFETIDTAFGERDCDVYAQDIDGKEYIVWYCGDTAYRIQYDIAGVTVVGDLTENSMFSPEPPALETRTLKDVEVGDSMEVVTTTYDALLGTIEGETVTSQTVTAVGDGTVTVDESVDGAAAVSAEYPLDVFLTGLDDMSGSVVIGEGVFTLGGVDIACDCIVTELYGYEITSLIADGHVLMSMSEAQGLVVIVTVSSTSLLV